MFRPEGKLLQMWLASKGQPLIKWPPDMKIAWKSRISLAKMRLSRIGILVLLGTLLCLPGGEAHLGTIDTLNSSFAGPCIYDGAYGKANPLFLILILTFIISNGF